MYFDAISAAFAFGGSAFLGLNCYRLYRDRGYRGVSPFASAFFWCWAAFNIAFFFHLEQWLTFASSVLMFCANTLYVGLMWRFGPYPPRYNGVRVIGADEYNRPVGFSLDDYREAP